MAWSAPSEWDRWDPEQFLVCPYEQSHRVPAKRYQYHVIKCRENYPAKDFVSCPFNAKHIMLRPELRHHITRCQDRGEVEPYSYKGNEKDSNGFYFKGDTSVPCHLKEKSFVVQDEDWDREDEQTMSKNNICEYYANLSSVPPQCQAIKDVSSLNPSDREEFKRNVRTEAVQGRHGQYRSPGQCFQTASTHQEQRKKIVQENYSSTVQQNYSSTVQQPGVQKNQYDKPRCGYSNYVNGERREETAASNMNVPGWCLPSHKANNMSVPAERNAIGRRSNGARLISNNESRIVRNEILENQEPPVGEYQNIISSLNQTQRNVYSTGTVPHGNQRNISLNNPHGKDSFTNRPEGADTQTTRFAHGAGRARLAEEARRARFGVSSSSGLQSSSASLGRGRGILGLYYNP